MRIVGVCLCLWLSALGAGGAHAAAHVFPASEGRPARFMSKDLRSDCYESRVQRAVRWLALQSEKADGPVPTAPVVDQLLYFLFARNLAPEGAVRVLCGDVLAKRCPTYFVLAQENLPRDVGYWNDYVVTAYVLSRLGRPSDQLFARCRQLAFDCPALVSPLSPPPSALDADATQKLMILGFLADMALVPNRTVSAFLQARRKHLELGVAGDDLKQRMYFATHAVFSATALGSRLVDANVLREEIDLLEAHMSSPRIVEDSDLWSEVYVALALVHRRTTRRAEDTLASIAVRQQPDGGWQPDATMQTGRTHLTQVISLALLCSCRFSDGMDAHVGIMRRH
jgi:hypothetical protein